MDIDISMLYKNVTPEVADCSGYASTKVRNHKPTQLDKKKSKLKRKTAKKSRAANRR